MKLSYNNSVLMSYCKGYMGYNKDLISRMYYQLFKISTDLPYDSEIACCLLGKEMFTLLLMIDGSINLDNIIFDEMRPGFVFPEAQPFYEQLFTKLRSKLAYACVDDLKFDKVTNI